MKTNGTLKKLVVDGEEYDVGSDAEIDVTLAPYFSNPHEWPCYYSIYGTTLDGKTFQYEILINSQDDLDFVNSAKDIEGELNITLKNGSMLKGTLKVVEYCCAYTESETP